MLKLFIDGREGTTGLRIAERLEGRSEFEQIRLPEDKRKDPAARAEALNAADLAILCLPDAAAREAVAMVTNPATRILDASTAHRTAPGWVYGFPELAEGGADAVRGATRLAVPGCHASGFVALVAPLVRAGVLPADAALSCHSLTGYSGGGKKMIAEYEGEGRDRLLDAPRQYGLSQSHKHLPEMKAIAGLSREPLFCPIVSDFYSGMEVTVPLFFDQLAPGKTVEDIRRVYRELYTGPIVRYADGGDEGGLLSASALSGHDRMEIGVFGNEDRILLVARFDNLGKGASGAAVECLNLMIGKPAETGLCL
jgi:N-acetyl-gamma-glutamyl-phosphate reductase